MNAPQEPPARAHRATPVTAAGRDDRGTADEAYEQFFAIIGDLLGRSGPTPDTRDSGHPRDDRIGDPSPAARREEPKPPLLFHRAAGPLQQPWRHRALGARVNRKSP